MFINTISFNSNFQTNFCAINKKPKAKLSLLSDYKKPLLQLTNEDKDAIAKIEVKIKQIQEYIIKKNNEIKYKNFSIDKRRSFNTFMQNNEESIAELKEQIRQIKIKRYKQQLEELTQG